MQLSLEPARVVALVQVVVCMNGEPRRQVWAEILHEPGSLGSGLGLVDGQNPADMALQANGCAHQEVRDRVVVAAGPEAGVRDLSGQQARLAEEDLPRVALLVGVQRARAADVQQPDGQSEQSQGQSQSQGLRREAEPDGRLGTAEGEDCIHGISTDGELVGEGDIHTI